MTEKAVVVIPFHKPEMNGDEKKSLECLQKNLNAYDCYFALPEGLAFQAGDFLIKRFEARHFQSERDYNQLLMRKEFYKAFSDYEFILIYQLDSFIFSGALKEWCRKDFDYIGAPWIKDAGSSWIDQDRVGNGGFSLRRVAAFLRVLENYENKRGFGKRLMDPILKSACRVLEKAPPETIGFQKIILGLKRLGAGAKWTFEHEDIFWSMEAGKVDPEFKVASVEEGLAFSFEVNPRECFERNGNKLPFGCHGWPRHDRLFWESLTGV
jgi:hypothetical protein